MSEDLLRDRVVAAVGDEYDLESELGRGGMAVVYRARDLRLRRLVAIKVLPPELAFRAEIRSRFLREAETAAQLSHPHIVPIYSFGERAGIVFFVMGLVDGRSLAEELHHEPRPPVERVRRVLRETADALAYAHRRGVVHRDIKPDNILIERETGRAMVTDFGIARAAEAGQRLTQTGIAVGTPTYMSPEQAMGEREVDGRADVYSLGVVGYQMLAGQPPFDASSTPAMLMKHISERPRPLAELRPDLPANVVHAIDRALAKGPSERWPDAAAFRDALDESAHVDPASLGGTSRSGSGAPGARPRAPQEITPAGISRPAATWEAGGLRVSVSRGGDAPASTPPRAPDPRPAPPSRHPEPRHPDRHRGREPRSIPEEIAAYHRHLIGSGAGILTCWVINVATGPEFLWAIFPTLGMGMGLIGHGASLWSKGVPLRRIFSRQQLFAPEEAAPPPAVASGARAAIPSATAVHDEAVRLAGAEVVAGPYGEPVRRAVADRAAILGIVERLPKEDRALLPDVAPTVNALIERVGALAGALHRLGGDIDADAIARLDRRIEGMRAETGASAERERTRTLLERQRASMHDLLERRERLLSQLESAGLVLGNLKLDLLKLRSTGLGASVDDVANATQEARALSRDIGHVIDAASQVRAL